METQDPTFPQCVGVDVAPVHIVDVGAMAESRERYHALVAQNLAAVTGFEPNPEELRILNARGGSYRYLDHVLGDGGDGTLHFTRYPGCTSLLEPDPAVIDLFVNMSASGPQGNFTVVRKVPVKTTRLDDLPLERAVDYLKLDIQGGELDVLRGAVRTLCDTLVVETEVEFVPLYKNQPLFGDIDVFLRQQGFLLHKLIDVGGRAFHPLRPHNPSAALSQILWADAIFVRDFRYLARYTDVQLLQSAMILDTVYSSADLAALLLGEYDRRRATGCRARYVAALPRPSHAYAAITLKEHIETIER